MKTRLLAIVAIITLCLFTNNVNAQESTAAAPAADIMLTSDLTVEGQAVLAPGSVVGDDWDCTGLKYGDFQLPSGYTLRKNTTLTDPLYLKSGAVIPAGTKISGSSKFENTDQLPPSAYQLGGNLIPGNESASPADLTLFSRKQQKKNQEIDATFSQAAGIFEQQAADIATNTGEIKKLRVDLDATNAEVEKQKKKNAEQDETILDFKSRLQKLEAGSKKVSSTTPAKTNKTTSTAPVTTSVTMGTPNGTVHDPMVQPPHSGTVRTLVHNPVVQKHVSPVVQQYCQPGQPCGVQYQQPTVCRKGQPCAVRYRSR